MNGIAVVWERGPREISDKQKGKNGGPLVKQAVNKHFIPKAKLVYGV